MDMAPTVAMDKGNESLQKMRVSFLINDLPDCEESEEPTSQACVQEKAPSLAMDGSSFHLLSHLVTDWLASQYSQSAGHSGSDCAFLDHRATDLVHYNKSSASRNRNHWPEANATLLSVL